MNVLCSTAKKWPGLKNRPFHSRWKGRLKTHRLYREGYLAGTRQPLLRDQRAEASDERWGSCRLELGSESGSNFGVAEDAGYQDSRIVWLVSRSHRSVSRRMDS